LVGVALTMRQTPLLTCLFVGLSSSLGTISIKKSNWSNFDMAIAISFLWRKHKIF